jgi:PAS domain S-box-containing protein
MRLEQSHVAGRDTILTEGTIPPIFGRAPLPMVISDVRTGRILDANRAFSEFSGFSRDELLGNSTVALGLISADAREQVIASLQRGKAATQSLTLRRKDGSQRIALVYLDEVQGAEGLLVSFLVDITDRVELERNLASNEEKLRRLIESATEHAIYMLDPAGRIVTWNAGAERLKGYKAEEVLGRHFSIFYTDDARRRGAPAKALQEALATGRFVDEGWRVRKDGTQLWAAVVVTPVFDAQGHHLGFVKVTRDLTEPRAAEEAAKLAAEKAEEVRRLQQIDAARRDLLNFVSHELKTPITPLLLQSQLLGSGRLGPLTAQQKRSLEILQRNLERIQSLVNDILEVGKNHSPHARVQLSRGDIVRVAREAVQTFEDVGKEKGIDLEFDAPTAIHLDMDASRVSQVLSNLLSNALKATQPGGTVRVSLRQTRGVAEIEVADTGRGLAPEELERLFRPFSQVKDGSQREGTGLGLYICKGIVELHGGSIACSSAGLGKGATFRVRLPIEAPPAETGRSGPENPTSLRLA